MTDKQTCANCKEYQECLKKWYNTILSETEEMKDCVCSMWQRGKNIIQESLFDYDR